MWRLSEVKYKRTYLVNQIHICHCPPFSPICFTNFFACVATIINWLQERDWLIIYRKTEIRANLRNVDWSMGLGRAGSFSCSFMLQHALKHLLWLHNKLLRTKSNLQPLAVGIPIAHNMWQPLRPPHVHTINYFINFGSVKISYLATMYLCSSLMAVKNGTLSFFIYSKDFDSLTICEKINATCYPTHSSLWDRLMLGDMICYSQGCRKLLFRFFL